MSFWKRMLSGHDDGATVESLRNRLHHFRNLVARNNQVLELIADAGEKLGGEYIFDIQYLRTLSRELRDATRDVVDDLNAITSNHHVGLVDIVQAIDDDVNATLESRLVVPKSDLVLPFHLIDEESTGTAGLKMARLGEVRDRLRCTVPDGFVVSSYACARFLEAAGVTPDYDSANTAPERWTDARIASTALKLQRRVRATAPPRDLARAIRRACRTLVRKRPGCTLAVRSSAMDEDGENSFAGQYRTVLGVDPPDILDAYREVVASLFSAGVMTYRCGRGLPPTGGVMAVGCLAMVDARASGVAYTLDPVHPDREVLVISAAPGLGTAVVQGSSAVDRFELSRTPPHTVVARRLGHKEAQDVIVPGEGVRRVPLPNGARTAPTLDDEQLALLAATTLHVEKHRKCAQDVEWAIDGENRLVILQVRPLGLLSQPHLPRHDLHDLADRFPVLLQGKGAIACRGIGHGRVFLVSGDESLQNVPRGVVLVARTATPRLARAMSAAAAVITDVGTATGHLAAIAREFRVPAIVDAETATRVLEDGCEVTVDAEENIIYDGRVDPLLHHQLLQSSTYEETLEFRLLRRILRRIAPLNLVDPQSRKFNAAHCTTYHDIVRFCHEKAVEELTGRGWATPSRGGPFVRRLEMKLPLDLVLIDLDAGMQTAATGAQELTPENVTSLPLRALLQGLMAEGVWASNPARLDMNGLMSSITRSTSPTSASLARPERNLAIVSRNYLHLSLHLGYHFNIVDAYVSDTRNENHIYFRFAGGVTDITRRSRRARVLREILARQEFVVEGEGDLVVGRLKKAALETILERLEMTGRLIGFTRQLDVALRDDDLVDRFVEGFMRGVYDPQRL